MKIIFLGTGGGRIVTVSQERCTGGIYIKGKKRLHIDPGPGAALLLKKEGLSPLQTDALLISHCHPDHYNDAEVLLEGMYLKERRPGGTLIAPKSVTEGLDSIGPGISRYHLGKAGEVITARPDREIELGDLKVMPFRTYHNDPLSVGFIIRGPEGSISYISDTSLNENLLLHQRDIDLLVLSVTRPLQSRIRYHLATEDAAYLVERIRPKMAVFTHFGRKALRAIPELQAGWTYRKTRVKTVAAEDGMVLELNRGEVELLRERWSDL